MHVQSADYNIVRPIKVTRDKNKWIIALKIKELSVVKDLFMIDLFIGTLFTIYLARYDCERVPVRLEPRPTQLEIDLLNFSSS